MNALVASLTSFSKSSIGKKTIVALTGLAMVLFLIGHLLGNLLIFKGPEAINSYGKLLKDNKMLLIFARAGILTCFVLHIFYTILLVRQNKAARPVEYQFKATRRATGASRTMIWSGLIVLAFVFYHLAHYTWGIANGYYDASNARYIAPEGHHIYNMLVDGFKWVPASLFYLVAIGLLCFHLSHGITSCFQTLGLTTPNTRSPIDFGSRAFSALLFVGYASIPVSVLLGIVR